MHNSCSTALRRAAFTYQGDLAVVPVCNDACLLLLIFPFPIPEPIALALHPADFRMRQEAIEDRGGRRDQRMPVPSMRRPPFSRCVAELQRKLLILGRSCGWHLVEAPGIEPSGPLPHHGGIAQVLESSRSGAIVTQAGGYPTTGEHPPCPTTAQAELRAACQTALARCSDDWQGPFPSIAAPGRLVQEE